MVLKNQKNRSVDPQDPITNKKIDDRSSPVKNQKSESKKKTPQSPSHPSTGTSKSKKSNQDRHQLPENDKTQVPSRKMQSPSSPIVENIVDRVSERQGRVSRINMDGTISHDNYAAEPLTQKHSRSPEQKSTSAKGSKKKINKKKNDVVVIQDKKLAKKIRKYISKKERKRKRQERYRQDPSTFLNQMNSSSDSLGDMSRSTIESLYGSVGGKGGWSQSPKLSPNASPPTKIRQPKIECTVFHGGSPNGVDDDDDRWEEDLADTSGGYVSLSNSTENDELLKAATAALEKYQRRWSMSNDGMVETDDEEMENDGMIEAPGEQHIDHPTTFGEHAGFPGYRLVVNKSVVEEFVKEMENSSMKDVPSGPAAERNPGEEIPPMLITEQSLMELNQSISLNKSPTTGKKTTLKPRKSKDSKKKIGVKSNECSEKNSDDKMKTGNVEDSTEMYRLPDHVDLDQRDSVSLDLTYDFEIQGDENSSDGISAFGHLHISAQNESNALKTSRVTTTTNPLDTDPFVNQELCIPFTTQRRKNSTIKGRTQTWLERWNMICLSVIIIGGGVALAVWILSRNGKIDFARRNLREVGTL